MSRPMALLRLQPKVLCHRCPKDTDLDPLQERRRMSRLVFLYKVLNDLVGVKVSQMDIMQSHRPTQGSSTSTKQRGCPTHQNI